MLCASFSTSRRGNLPLPKKSGSYSAELRVMIVDSALLFRQGVSALLSGHPGIKMVAATGGVEEAVATAIKTAPSVILLGSHLAPAAYLAATRHLSSAMPKTKVLILTSLGDRHFLSEAARAGAAGVVRETVSGDELAEIIGAICRNGTRPSPNFVPLVNGGSDKGPSGVPDAFGVTEQELRVLAGVVEGQRNGEIAGRLAISPDTVKAHLKRLFGKLGVKSRTEAAVVGLSWGLLDERKTIGGG